MSRVSNRFPSSGDGADEYSTTVCSPFDGVNGIAERHRFTPRWRGHPTASPVGEAPRVRPGAFPPTARQCSREAVRARPRRSVVRDETGVVVAQVAQHVSTPRTAERDQHVVDVVGRRSSVTVRRPARVSFRTTASRRKAFVERCYVPRRRIRGRCVARRRSAVSRRASRAANTARLLPRWHDQGT